MPTTVVYSRNRHFVCRRELSYLVNVRTEELLALELHVRHVARLRTLDGDLWSVNNAFFFVTDALAENKEFVPGK